VYITLVICGIRNFHAFGNFLAWDRKPFQSPAQYTPPAVMHHSGNSGQKRLSHWMTVNFASLKNVSLTKNSLFDLKPLHIDCHPLTYMYFFGSTFDLIHNGLNLNSTELKFSENQKKRGENHI
jgi:hypothetical protein